MILDEDLFELVTDTTQMPDAEIDIDPIEDTSDLRGPETPEDNAISQIIIQIINSKWELINQINSDLISLQGIECEDEKEVLNSILNDETNHIGKLQAILTISSPNVDNIKCGELDIKEIDDENN